jgi:hypothetical protein
LKAIGYCIGALILLFLLFLAFEHFRGKSALTHRLAELKARGEVLSVAALEPKHPMPEQNAAIALFSLSNRFETVTNLDDARPPLRIASPGRAIVAWRLKEWIDHRNTTNNWSKIGAELQKSEELLRQAHAALENSAYDSGFNYRTGFVDFQLAPLSNVKRAAQLFSIAATYELNQGNLGAANQYLQDSAKLVARQTPEPLIICQLVRYASAGIALHTLWDALQAPGWTEPQLASLQAAWTHFDFGSDMSTACKMERALAIDFFQQIKASRNKLALVIDEREKAGEISEGLWNNFLTHGVILRWLNVPLWRVAWADQDELRALDRWEQILQRQQLAQTDSWLALVSSVPDAIHEPTSYQRFRFLFSTETFSINDAMIKRTLFAQTEQAMAVTAIALQRYRLSTGTVPASLSALVPEFLPLPPRDAMDGKMLRYRVLPQESFILYSVGEDGKDDGGNPAMSSEKQLFRRIWDGRDAVWPAAATDEEAVEAMNHTKQ